MSGKSSPGHVPTHSEDNNLRRSSSLSDIMDTADQDDLNMMPYDEQREGDPNDTEAETERLEDSPFKRQEQLSVVFPSSKVEQLHQNVDRSRSSSEASSLAASSDDELERSPPASPNRKRKNSQNDIKNDVSLPFIESPPADGRDISRSLSPQSAIGQSPSANDELPPDDDLSGSDSPSNASSTKAKANHKTRRSKLRKLEGNDDLVDAEDDQLPLAGERDDVADAENFNLDDGEGYEGAEADHDISSKNQEDIANKRSALDSLTSLEKCFATLRDKLFDERLAAANSELSLLQKPDFLHPELSAMKDAIDKHRQRKIRYQQTFLKHKLQTLQRESIAEKHQIQSQYMQTAREARDQALDKLNEEFYRVQRERRKGDNAVSDSIYLFTSNRTQQFRQQTAYNKEISIVSGLAKHVGFPAAPAIQEARPEEVEEDMRNMGIASHGPMFPQHYNFFRSAPLSQVSLGRQTPTAEENFLERNAWANPQHPAHLQRLQMHRQRSNQALNNGVVHTVNKGGVIGEKAHLATSSVADQPIEGQASYPSKTAVLSDGGRSGDLAPEEASLDPARMLAAPEVTTMSQKDIVELNSAAHQSNNSRDMTAPEVSDIPTNFSPSTFGGRAREQFEGHVHEHNTTNFERDRVVSRSPGQLQLSSPKPTAVAGPG